MARRKVDDPSAAAAVTFNMTPMIDVCFQLIVVFLCSMKFKTLDQKIEAFLPKEAGVSPCIPTHPVVPRVDLRLRRRKGEEATWVLVLDTFVAAEVTDVSFRGTALQRSRAPSR